jgi:hypothetical protein
MYIGTDAMFGGVNSYVCEKAEKVAPPSTDTSKLEEDVAIVTGLVKRYLPVITKLNVEGALVDTPPNANVVVDVVTVGYSAYSMAMPEPYLLYA